MPKVFRLNFLIASLAFLMFVGNLVMINSTIAKSYKTEKIENKFAEIENKNQKLSLELQEGQSMEGVAKKVRELGMVEAGSIKYINITDMAVAKK